MAKKMDPMRLELLKLLLLWEGRIGNARLRELLGLSLIRASQWLKEFREYQPDWSQWNSITRSYNATWEFYRDKHGDDSISLMKYLSFVGLPATTHSESHHVVVAAFPDIATPNPVIFAVLARASQMEREVEITYRSMRNPSPHKRIISPHSIIRSGGRWYVRAYCNLNQQFRNYSLGRISHAALLDQPAGFLVDDDKDWATKVPVRLIAHPDLNSEQESVIRFEYFMNTSSRITTCRGPLVNYYIKDVRAAVDIETQRPPEYQIAIGNIEEINKWLF